MATSSGDLHLPTIHTVSIPLLCESVFFGAYSVLFIFSTSVLSRRSPSRTRNIMLALSVVMYAVSAIHCALIVTLPLLPPGLNTYEDGYRIALAILYLPIINYFLSDGIVLWRAWVLWDGKWVFFIPPLISLMCTLGTTIASAVCFYEAFVKEGFGSHASSSFHLEWSIWFLTLGTNLWATGLIFIRAWQHRRFIRSLIKEASRSNTEKVLAFLIESGAIYACIWITYIAISFKYMGNYSVLSFQIAIAQVVGMYPTTIIVVIAMQLSTADVLSRPGAEANTHIVFASRSPNPLPQTSEVVQNSSGGRPIGVSSDATSA